VTCEDKQASKKQKRRAEIQTDLFAFKYYKGHKVYKANMYVYNLAIRLAIFC